MQKKILYLANNADLVLNKINAQKHAFETNGYSCDIKNEKYTFRKICGLKKIISSYDVVYIRHDIRFILLSIFWFYLFKNKYVILEIPTPISSIQYEIKHLKVSLIKKFLHFYLQPFLFFIACLKSNLIVEYAEDDSKIIHFFKDKVILQQNGLNNIEQYKIDNNYLDEASRVINRFSTQHELNIILVANIQEHHGVERLIYGLSNYYKQKNRPYKINLKIIAKENELLIGILDLANTLNISMYVDYIGQKKVDELKYYYKDAHIGLGSIGMNKINLSSGSPLKLKEYACFGLPSIIDYHDYDLSGKEYIYQASASTIPLDIDQLVEFYAKLVNKHGYELPYIISSYAKSHLLWSKKIIPVTNKMNIYFSGEKR